MPKCRETNAWERQPNESAPAFEAFKTYLEMGEQRSYVKVGQKLGKSRALIDRWGSVWNWQERVREYDNWLQAEADKKLVSAERQRRARLGPASDQYMFKALQMLEVVDPAKARSPETAASAAIALARMSVMLNDKHRTVLPRDAVDRESEDLLGALLLAFESEDNEHDKQS